MKFDRTKNASRNIIFGLLQRLYQLVVPFAIRTAMIYCLGMEYLGLDGLFVSILSVLNLAELGVGSAMVYSMYRPVAEDDKTKICALMKLYRMYYSVIGGIVLAGGVCFTPILPRLISGSIPEGINIYVLYYLNLGATVLSYWLFAYKNSLLQAYQRTDVASKVTMIVNTVRYAVQFGILFVWHNYYAYLIVSLASQAGINITTALVVDRMFPGLSPSGVIDKKETQTINHRIRDLFTAKIGSVVVSSVDTLVVSAFLGLTILAIYQNYYYIVTALLGVVNILIYSCTSGIGNSLITESKRKNLHDLKTFTFIISVLACFCTACLLTIYQPFMRLWVKRQELLFDYPAVVCFAGYFYIVEINTLLNNYKDAAGIWHEDRFRPLVTAVVNLGMNLLLVQFWGVYGILLSTVVSMLFVGMPWLLLNLFTTLFEKSMVREYLGVLAKYTGTSVIVCVISALLCNCVSVPDYLAIIVNAAICGITTISIYLILFRKDEMFMRSVSIVDRITRYKFRLSRIVEK